MRTSPAIAANDPPSDGQHARDRILGAARQLFQESGYEGTPVGRIARAAGMTPPNVYSHFPSKQDVLHEVLEGMYRSSYDELFASIPDGPAQLRLAAFVRAYVTIQLRDVVEDKRNFSYDTLASSLTEEMQHELAHIQRAYQELLRGILRQGREENVFVVDDVKVAAFAIVSCCEYVFTWYRANGTLSIAEVADRYVELMLRMAGYSSTT